MCVGLSCHIVTLRYYSDRNLIYLETMQNKKNKILTRTERLSSSETENVGDRNGRKNMSGPTPHLASN